MSGLYFEEFQPGARFVSTGRTLTQADILNFAGITGDFNPLHVDDEFARKTMYGGTVASTPLILALASGMFSQLGHVQGTGMGWVGLTSLKVHRYVHPGETLHLEVSVVAKADGPKPGVGTITWSEVLKDQKGGVVIEQVRDTMVLKRGPVSS